MPSTPCPGPSETKEGNSRAAGHELCVVVVGRHPAVGGTGRVLLAYLAWCRRGLLIPWAAVGTAPKDQKWRGVAAFTTHDLALAQPPKLHHNYAYSLPMNLKDLIPTNSVEARCLYTKYMYMRVCMYTCMYTCMYGWMYVCMYVYMYIIHQGSSSNPTSTYRRSGRSCRSLRACRRAACRCWRGSARSWIHEVLGCFYKQRGSPLQGLQKRPCCDSIILRYILGVFDGIAIWLFL